MFYSLCASVYSLCSNVKGHCRLEPEEHVQLQFWFPRFRLAGGEDEVVSRSLVNP